MTVREAKNRINELDLLKNSVGDFCGQAVRDYITDRATMLFVYGSFKNLEEEIAKVEPYRKEAEL